MTLKQFLLGFQRSSLHLDEGILLFPHGKESILTLVDIQADSSPQSLLGERAFLQASQAIGLPLPGLLWL